MTQDSLSHFEELALGSRLKRLSDSLMKEVAKVYTSLAIDFDPYHMPIFKLISEQKELTIGEISNLLKVTQPAVTQYIKALERKQLILCSIGKIDKRKKKISLSPLGEKMLQKLNPIWKVIDAELKILTHNSVNKSLLEHITFIEKETAQVSLSSTIVSKINR